VHSIQRKIRNLFFTLQSQSKNNISGREKMQRTKPEIFSQGHHALPPELPVSNHCQLNLSVCNRHISTPNITCITVFVLNFRHKGSVTSFTKHGEICCRRRLRGFELFYGCITSQLKSDVYFHQVVRLS
jgi:hypothetical protein